MDFTIFLWLGNPMTWVTIMMLIAIWPRLFRRRNLKPEDAARIMNVGASTPDPMAAVLMFMVMAHRPNHEFVAKAQIRETEDADEDDEGGPDTSKRQLMRQLRRIRRGEAVDRLVWRLE